MQVDGPHGGKLSCLADWIGPAVFLGHTLWLHVDDVIFSLTVSGQVARFPSLFRGNSGDGW